MSFLTIKKFSVNQAVAVFQVLLLLSYFILNIVNVGGMGTALPLLAGFVVLVGIGLFLQLWRGYLVVKLHFFVFLLFVAWLTVRVIVDLQDVEYLKQITVATTGGVLLFFLLGTFVRQALNKISLADKSGLAKRLLFVFTLSSVFVFMGFQGKILEQSEIFYIEGVEGGYQRPGNFMIMLFLMASFLYLSIAAKFRTRKAATLLVWLAVYSAGMLFSLINSQLIGSNAATANILAIYLMTVVLSFLMFNAAIRYSFLNNYLALPLSRLSLKKIIKYSTCAALFGVVAGIALIQATGFDLNKTRAFGFGAGENSSLNSRIEILKETGAVQMGHSPFLGNVDVARLTTGEAGKTLHSFIPNVIAELGLLGLGVVILLFSLVLRSIIKATKQSAKTEHGFMQAMLNLWLLFVFIFLFLYANLAVGKEWPVLWFFLGFAVSVFESGVNKEI